MDKFSRISKVDKIECDFVDKYSGIQINTVFIKGFKNVFIHLSTQYKHRVDKFFLLLISVKKSG